MVFRRILVPVDFSETSGRALDLAARLARDLGASIVLLHVGAVPEYPMAVIPPEVGTVPQVMIEMYERLAAQQRDALEKVAQDHVQGVAEYKLRTREGFPPEEILTEAAAEGCDLIVMGTHGRTGVSRVLMGSVAERVLRASQVPVLVVR
ncbi:universal stress protein [Myxococcota bacterium]|nr:universal stress protein [Myxococcota bacterium]